MIQINNGSETKNIQCFEAVFNASDALVTQRSEEHRRMKKRSNASSQFQEAAKGDGFNADWLKPFDEGWQREIVLRNSCQDPCLKKSDVYYYAPDRKKLRSCPEIESFLQTTKSSLSIDCFTFKKERIHLEPSEVVRQAAPTRGRNRVAATSVHSVSDVAVNASASTTASSSSSAVEGRTLPVAVNVEKGTRGSASRKRPQSTASVRMATKQQRTDKAQISDEWSAKLCSIYCFGQTRLVWPLDVFCAKCGYGFHFVCINKSCFTADYICLKCAPGSEKNNNLSTTADSKDVTNISQSLQHNTPEQSVSQTTSAKLEEHQAHLNKPFPRFYASRIPSCQHLKKNTFCIGSLPTTPPFCNLTNERSAFVPNEREIQPTEEKTTDQELSNGKRKLSGTETCRISDSEVCYYRLVYDSLEHIFKYLLIEDLLKCRLVCKTWKNIASQPSLWNSKSCDFPEREQNVKSRRKNARTDNLEEDDNVDSEDAFVRTSLLNRVNLGSCQCIVVEMVIDGNRDMRLFSAELFIDNGKNVTENQWPDDVVMNMQVFSEMDKLEILRLRAVGKLFPENLSQIGQMMCLRTLSLTSLHRVPGRDLESIFTLPKLTVLELGDCYQWNKEVFKKLGEMQHIESLKLEARDEEEDSGFGAALLKLKTLRRLELARYAIGAELSTVLPKLTQLQQLCIWTELLEDKAKTACLFNHLMTGVQEMSFLRGLYVAVIAPAAEDGLNWNVNIPVLSENGPGYEQTDIHHIYSQLQCKLTNTKIMFQAVPLYTLKATVKSEAAK